LLSIRYHQGITLLELLIVLAITVILTVQAVPAFVNLIERHRVSATAENLYYALQNARTEAVKRNALVYVSFQSGTSWCYGINTGSACSCAVPSGCNLGTFSYTAVSGISLSVTGFSSNTVQFDGTHGAANTTGSVTFTITGQSNLITVSVSRLGNLRMCSTGISGYAACS
jgi:type IV fimbrial biogenesis protein FimT